MLDRRHVQTLSFLVALPALNSIIIIAIVSDLGLFEWQSGVMIPLRLWIIFGGAYFVIVGVQKKASRWFPEHHFWKQLVLHVGAVVLLSMLITPLFDTVVPMDNTRTILMPRFILILQIVVYLAVHHIVIQQQLAFRKDMLLREIELNMLRAQSHPHFLFNTLNLIVTEITCDPDNAKEIVFDLSDLLRKSLNMAKKRITTLSEELTLISLFLTLQKKRFKERLHFEINADPNTLNLTMPALLLQPIIENTVKHAVAPFAEPAHISVEATRVKSNLIISFKDSGPTFNEQQLQEGNGLRILRETLVLEYQDDFEMSLRSTSSGGIFLLKIPVDKKG